ncbi:imidazole glycerol phosphate synthase subunit HisF [Pseudomonas sp. P115]|uniref:imidazole glycerol phosphate synthase subunit HisF n=1 Tax=Pseudomonas pisciculturae TaxID=2730413 RepID=UPI00135C081E|nr:imidazole glycerol phosphate synthase cyclase subunit [Pseudomonas pisciculturae]MBF6026839.1 imidazole glycerol phosphate synthase subunit HisF [Pseudomonas pisciculturae]
MSNTRLIARLDVKGKDLIKGIHLEGLRKIGVPNDFAMRYYEQGIDELIYMDCVASLYGRNSLSELIENTARNVFIPLTVGGGVRSVDDVAHLLRCGADKVAVNTAAVGNPGLITEIARRFGSQCMVLSVEAKTVGPQRWEVFTDNGRESTGKDLLEWVKQAAQLGAGEILLTSVDREGTRKGFDLELVNAVTEAVDIPVIASGGMGSSEHAISAVKAGADAVAMADILHYQRVSLADIRRDVSAAGVRVRSYE